MSGAANFSPLADDKRDRHYTSDEEEEDLDTTAVRFSPSSSRVLVTHTVKQYIHEIMKKLHIQEAYGLGRNPTNLHSVKAADNYFYRVFLETARYIRFVFWTWWSLTITTLVGGLGLFDWFTMFFYAFGGTVVLFFVLVGCLILNSPILKATYWRWSHAYVSHVSSRFGAILIFFSRAGGLGLVNNANSSLFQALTQTQADAGKKTR